MITMQQIMTSMATLKPLPATAPKIAMLVADANSTLDQLASVIQYDQALTLDVLKFANSVMSASSRSIATVKDAVVRLGGARILERIIGGHVKNTMTAPIELYGYQENDLWRHSVAAAVAAEQLASITKSKFGGLSFTAALLHDIGKLILGRSAPQEDMEQIAKLIYDKEVLVTCEQAEKKVFGFSHADIGAEIAISWQLPHLISNAIRHHHSLGITDENVDERIITDSVKVANIVARAMGEGIGNEGMSLSVDNDISNRLSLSRDQFETICALSAQKLAAVLAMFEK